MAEDEKPPSDLGGSRRRETLSERFKRIIGFSPDEIDYDEPLTGSGSRRTKSPTRRRDQILQAQRSHRQRTQLYIRELEKEVIRLRSSEETARKTLNKSREKNAVLLSELRAHNITSPPDLESPNESSNTAASASISSSLSLDEARWSQTVTVDLMALESTEPKPTCDIGPAFAQAPNYDPSPSTLDLTASRDLEKSSEAQLDTQSAVDFVLTLERPCLAHIKYAYIANFDLDPKGAFMFNSGPAHSFNISSSLVQGSNAEHVFTSPFEVPKVDIDQLLATSHNLGLSENEITPVQIWATLRGLSNTQVITKELLAVFTTELSRYSRCNGFGTVIDKSVVDAIFALVFGLTSTDFSV